MEHLILQTIEIAGGLILVLGYPIYRKHKAERWACIALLLAGLTGLIFGLFGILLHHNPLGLTSPQFLRVTSLRSMTGGISIGIFIALVASGQFVKLGLKRKKEQNPEPRH